jgi:multidrug resistance efflux pump
VALLALSAAGAGWVLRTQAGDTSSRGGADNNPAPSEPTVTVLGQVDVENGVTALAPSLPYRVTEVLIQENATVKAGDVLLRLEDRLPHLDLEKAENGVKAAQKQLELAQAAALKRKREIALQKYAIQDAENDLARARELVKELRPLYKDKFIGVKEMKLAEAAVDKYELKIKVEKEKLEGMEEIDAPAIQIKQAEDDLAVRKAEAERARYAVTQCELKAPEDGTILRVTVNRGDQFGPQSRQPAFVFCPNRKRLIRAEVEQEFAHRVKKGQLATVQDDSPSSDTWHGKVVRLAEWYTARRQALPDPFTLNDVRTLECLIELEPGQTPPRIGQRVRVTLGR